MMPEKASNSEGKNEPSIVLRTWLVLLGFERHFLPAWNDKAEKAFRTRKVNKQNQKKVKPGLAGRPRPRNRCPP
jgi:hypothetical protein